MMDSVVTVNGAFEIRVVGADERQLASIRWHLGASRAARNGEPDLTIVFSDVVPPASGIRVGSDVVDSRGYLYLSERGAWVRLDPALLGTPSTVTCDRRLTHVPYLQDFVTLGLLRIGAPAIHGASCVFADATILAAAWSGGGKTEVLLGLVAAGARPMADEWTILGPAPGVIRGLSSPVRLTRRHGRLWPNAHRSLHWTQRVRIRGAASAADAFDRFARPSRVGRHVAELIRSRSHVDVDARQLFGDSLVSDARPLDVLLIIERSELPRVRLIETDAAAVAARMAFAHTHHRRVLMDHLAAAGFVHPDAVSRGGDGGTLELERTTAERLLSGVPSFILRLPRRWSGREVAQLIAERISA